MILARNYLEVYPYDKWSDKVIPWSNINGRGWSSTSLPTSDLSAKHLLTISGCWTQSLCPEWMDQEAVSKRFSFPSGYPAVSERVSLSAQHSGDGGWGNQSSLAPHRSRSHCSHGKTRHWSVLGSVASCSWQREFSPGNCPNVAGDKKLLKCAEKRAIEGKVQTSSGACRAPPVLREVGNFGSRVCHQHLAGLSASGAQR